MNTLFSSTCNQQMYHETERKQAGLKVFNNELTVRMAELRLQMKGIPCLVRSLQGGFGLWGTAYNLPHDLLVYEANEARAREVLLILPREEQEPCQESEEESSLMPPWMLIVIIVAIMAFISFDMAIASK